MYPNTISCPNAGSGPSSSPALLGRSVTVPGQLGMIHVRRSAAAVRRAQVHPKVSPGCSILRIQCQGALLSVVPELPEIFQKVMHGIWWSLHSRHGDIMLDIWNCAKSICSGKVLRRLISSAHWSSDWQVLYWTWEDFVPYSRLLAIVGKLAILPWSKFTTPLLSCLLHILVCVGPQCLLVQPLVFELLILYRDPGHAYPLLE